MTDIAIERVDSYDKEIIRNALTRMFENTSFPDVRGKKLLIKPNILSDAPKEKAITTNPVVVEALIEIVKERGASSILVGDSPGLQSPSFNARTSGIKDVIDRTGAKFEDFTKNNRTHAVYKKIKVPMAKAIDDVDIVISVAKFKTHQLMMQTGAVKNMFGLVPGLNKSPLHLKCPSIDEFARLIVSIFKESHTDYAIIDGIIGMEGAGPANGEPRKVGLLISSEDAFAADYAEAVIMGYDKKDMPIFLEGERENLTNPDEYRYPLLKAEELVLNNFKKIESKRKSLFSALILPFFSRHFAIKRAKRRSAPEFKENCVKCCRCIEICPAKALVMGEKHPDINTDACIRCYCCHEMCPVDAIKVLQ